MAYATVQELADELRVALTPAITPRLQSCLDAAALEINDAIDVPPESLGTEATWTFQIATAAADPGSGGVRRNRTSAPAATELYLSKVDSGGTTRALDVTTDDRIRMRDYGSAWRFDDYVVTAAVVDQGTWILVPVDLIGTSAEAFAPAEGEPVALAAVRPAAVIGMQLALAKRVNLLRGVEWAKANDAAFGVIGFDEIGALRVPKDGFVRHAATLMPLKRQWGVA